MSELSSPLAVWNDNEVQMVATMLDEGASASVIASIFNITRNAAIGRIARNPDLHKHVKPKLRRKVKRSIPLKATPVKTKPAVASKVEPVKPMPLIDTGSLHCKWPIADDETVLGGILCCGDPVSFGLVYCVPHHRQAHPREGLK
jgi:hypothetical protein